VKLTILFALVLLSACQSTQTSTYTTPAPAPPPAPSLDELATQNQIARTNWLLRYTSLTSQSTTEGYACISEMYSLTYDPVDSGPACYDFCESKAKVNEMVDSAPSFISDTEKQHYHLETTRMCKSVLSYKKNKHSAK